MTKYITSILVFLFTATFAVAEEPLDIRSADPFNGAIVFEEGHNAKIRQSMDKGIAYLRSTQDKSGGWVTPRTVIGPTTIVLAGLLDAGVDIDDPMIVSGLKLIEASTRDDGGVYTVDGFLHNYETCCAIMCFVKANAAAKKKHGKEPYKDLLAKAEKFLRTRQLTEENGLKPEDPHYGGIGYTRGTRPDMSNIQFFLDALKATGAKEDDPAIQKALVFVSRCQNLESEHNNMPFLARNAENLDGGFIYYNLPDPAGEKETEGLRSYGGMTYAGFKSFIYAGLTKEDKRYKAALDWIAKNYSVKENPGRGMAGLYYYYQTMAKTLDVYQSPTIEDASGKKNNWRTDLSEHLMSIQKTDGSWVNENAQYMENDANLVTGYVLLTLALCLDQ
jgi:squalene-hopene/tetraprenyl-beta-curcumene cyclase